MNFTTFLAVFAVLLVLSLVYHDVDSQTTAAPGGCNIEDYKEKYYDKDRNLIKKVKNVKVRCGFLGRLFRLIFGRKKTLSKRVEVNDPVVYSSGSGSLVKRFPAKFSNYDKNGDKLNSFSEFSNTLYYIQDQSELRKLFDSIDTNADGHISCPEFLASPLDFESTPTC